MPTIILKILLVLYWYLKILESLFRLLLIRHGGIIRNRRSFYRVFSHLALSFLIITFYLGNNLLYSIIRYRIGPFLHNWGLNSFLNLRLVNIVAIQGSSRLRLGRWLHYFNFNVFHCWFKLIFKIIGEDFFEFLGEAFKIRNQRDFLTQKIEISIFTYSGLNIFILECNI